MAVFADLPDELVVRILTLAVQAIPRIRVAPKEVRDPIPTAPSRTRQNRHTTRQRNLKLKSPLSSIQSHRLHLLRTSFTTFGLVNRTWHRLLPSALMAHPDLNRVIISLDKTRNETHCSHELLSHLLFTENLTFLHITLGADDVFDAKDWGRASAALKAMLQLPKLGKANVRLWLWQREHGKEDDVADWLTGELQAVNVGHGKKVTVQWAVGFGWTGDERKGVLTLSS